MNSTESSPGSIADRLYAIDRGEIIFEGKPEQALEDANVMKALRG